MKLLVRAVVTGFGLSVGAAIYKRLAKQLGLDEKAAPDETARSAVGAHAADPGTLKPSLH
jgi:hypothetical protein